MSQFEWTGPLTAEEKLALRNYKDFSWMGINSRLRNENALDEDDEEVILLDRAIQRGRCTEPVTLFRATGRDFLSIESNVVKPDKAFLSTSIRDDGLGSFFEPNPVKLIIECPRYTAMALFEHDAAGGEEHERLLPRGTRFRIKAQRIVPNRFSVDEEEGPFNRHYSQLQQRFGNETSILVYTVEPI